MNIKPTNDLVVIKKINPEQPTTASGILLPPVEESADTPYKGIVLAVGPGKPAKLSPAGENVVGALQELYNAFRALPNYDEGARRGLNLIHWQRAADAINEHNGSSMRIPMQVKAGDVVVFSRNGHQIFKIDGEEVIVCQEASIMGVVQS